ncbi:hypothetical protein [Hymenobacter ruber]
MSDCNNLLRQAGLAFIGLTVEASISGKANGLHLPVLRYSLTVSGKGLSESITTTAATETDAIAEAKRRVAINKRSTATLDVLRQLRGDWDADEREDARHKMLTARTYTDFCEVVKKVQIADQQKRQQQTA